MVINKWSRVVLLFVLLDKPVRLVPDLIKTIFVSDNHRNVMRHNHEFLFLLKNNLYMYSCIHVF